MNKAIKKKLQAIHAKLNPAVRIERRMREQLFFQRKMILDNNLLIRKESGVTEERYCDHDIIVSLTTFGRRIHSVYLTLESLMEQSMKPNRIILWLDNSFKGKRLPKTLEILKSGGVEIAFCKDVRSYKKLLPALCKYPDDAIITVDDDILYDVNMIENLVQPYLENPNYIYCNRAHKMLLDHEGGLVSYNDWDFESKDTNAGLDIFPTGVGGVLYPPHSLDKEVFNEEVFMDICQYADDVWFKAMALKKGTKAKKVDTINARGCEYYENVSVQDIGLFNINAGTQNRNDEQIKAVFSKYNLYHLLKKGD